MVPEFCAGVTLRIVEHSVEASEARWIADPFIDQLRFDFATEYVVVVVVIVVVNKAWHCYSFDVQSVSSSRP